MAISKTNILEVTLNISPIDPIKGGITAPPETAMIINPEISLLLSGYFSTVREKIRGKIRQDQTKGQHALPLIGSCGAMRFANCALRVEEDSPGYASLLPSYAL